MACHEAPMPPRMVLSTVAASTVTVTSPGDSSPACETHGNTKQTATTIQFTHLRKWGRMVQASYSTGRYSWVMLQNRATLILIIPR